MSLLLKKLCCCTDGCPNGTNCADGSPTIITTCTGSQLTVGAYSQDFGTIAVPSPRYGQYVFADIFSLQPSITFTSPASCCMDWNGGEPTVVAYYRSETDATGTRTFDATAQAGVSLTIAYNYVFTSGTETYRRLIATVQQSIFGVTGGVDAFVNFGSSSTAQLSIALTAVDSYTSGDLASLCAGDTVDKDLEISERDTRNDGGNETYTPVVSDIGSLGTVSTNYLTSVDQTSIGCRQCDRHLNMTGTMWFEKEYSVDDAGLIFFNRAVEYQVRGRLVQGCGGECGTPFGCSYVGGFERLDPDTGTWESLGAILIERVGPKLWKGHFEELLGSDFYILADDCCLTGSPTIEYSHFTPQGNDPDPLTTNFFDNALTFTATGCIDSDTDCFCDDPCVRCGACVSAASAYSVTFDDPIVGTRTETIARTNTDPCTYLSEVGDGYSIQITLEGGSYVFRFSSEDSEDPILTETMPCTSGDTIAGDYSGSVTVA